MSKPLLCFFAIYTNLRLTKSRKVNIYPGLRLEQMGHFEENLEAGGLCNSYKSSLFIL